MNSNNGIFALARPAVSRRRFLQGASLTVGAMAFGGGMIGRARAEDKVTWYTGTAVEASDDLTKTFTEKTGIPADYFRAGGLKAAQKFEQEVKANQVAASVVSIALPSLVAQWVEQGLVMEYESPEYSAFPDSVVIPGYSAPISADPQSPAYNTELVTAEEAPKTWEDLLDPKWKGKMTMVDATSSGGALHWYSAMRKHFGKEYMEKLATQDILVRTGGGDVVNTLISGERPVAAILTQYHALKPISQGAALRLVTPDEGVPINYNTIFIPAAAPNPEGGKKFLDYALSKEAQTFLGEKYFTGSFRNDVGGGAADTGAKPLSEVTPMASSREDMAEFFEKQEELAEEYATFFK